MQYRLSFSASVLAVNSSGFFWTLMDIFENCPAMFSMYSTKMKNIYRFSWKENFQIDWNIAQDS